MEISVDMWISLGIILRGCLSADSLTQFVPVPREVRQNMSLKLMQVHPARLQTAAKNRLHLANPDRNEQK